jgi:hypothetical protein
MLLILLVSHFCLTFTTTDNMKAEFIGIDAINENLKDFQFDAIGVYQGKLEKFKRSANDDESEEDLIKYFNQWCDRMMASNPNNFQSYSVQLYDLPEGGKKLMGTSSFTFQLTEKPEKQFIGDDHKNNGSITKRELELALENQRLEFEKHLLEKELSDVDDDDFDDDKNIGMMGAIQETVMGKLPALIDLLIMTMAPKQNNTIPSGIGSNIDEILFEFKKINPSIESDLQKLLELAKNKPDLFKMLITQLRSM